MSVEQGDILMAQSSLQLSKIKYRDYMLHNHFFKIRNL